MIERNSNRKLVVTTKTIAKSSALLSNRQARRQHLNRPRYFNLEKSYHALRKMVNEVLKQEGKTTIKAPNNNRPRKYLTGSMSELKRVAREITA